MKASLAPGVGSNGSPSLHELVARHRPGWSLDRSFYTDPATFEVDFDRVWRRQWLFAGHAGQIAAAGDFFTIQIGQDSLIVIRDEAGLVHALANCCRHRGSRICTEPSGNVRGLVCPYHQWAYSLDGSLHKARLMPQDFDAQQFGLHRAEVRVAQGLIFVCLSADPPDFSPFAQRVAPRLRHHDLDRARVAHARTYEVQANWKLVVENSRECYHCGVGHPQYCRAVGFAAAIGSRSIAATEATLASQRYNRLAEHGIEADEVPFQPGTWFRSRRFFLRQGYSTESLDGQPVAPLMGTVPDWDAGALVVVALPNLLLEASPDYVMTLALFPAGPTLTTAHVRWLVRDDAAEGADYTVDRLTEFWRLTLEQDWKLCEDNQAGVNSHFYAPGPYAPDEGGVAGFIEWYLGQLL